MKGSPTMPEGSTNFVLAKAEAGRFLANSAYPTKRLFSLKRVDFARKYCTCCFNNINVDSYEENFFTLKIKSGGQNPL